ncbi:HAD-IA family hydrolase [Singulisphaera rosea]
MRTAWDGIRGIVLDAVGTLIEPSPSVAEVYGEAARRQGVTLDRETIRGRFLRHLGEDEVDEARGPLATDEVIERRRWRRVVGNVLVEVPDLERAFEELWEHFGRHESWRCYPDVEPLLEFLRSLGLPYRIGSNFDSRLRKIIEGLPELAHEAAPPLISSELGYRKPHPEFYRAVCKSLALPPGAILSVGDDLENDVLGASRAGLRSVWLDRRGTEIPKDEAIPRIPDLRVLVAGWRG